MTIGQAKRIVRFLLDAELYGEYEDKLNEYLDMGQKRIACTTDFIDREMTVETDAPAEIDMEQKDSRFYRLRKVEGGEWERLSPTRLKLGKGKYRIHYNIFPATITPHTPDSENFEVSEFAQSALPFYVAAQVSCAEHDLRYHQIYADEFAAVLENVHEARSAGKIHLSLQ